MLNLDKHDCKYIIFGKNTEACIQPCSLNGSYKKKKDLTIFIFIKIEIENKFLIIYLLRA